MSEGERAQSQASAKEVLSEIKCAPCAKALEKSSPEAAEMGKGVLAQHQDLKLWHQNLTRLRGEVVHACIVLHVEQLWAHARELPACSMLYSDVNPKLGTK